MGARDERPNEGGAGVALGAEEEEGRGEEGDSERLGKAYPTSTLLSIGGKDRVGSSKIGGDLSTNMACSATV